ncbi:MAG: S8 family serine peptidase [Euryarchaeota archaeon]|nr:S8 family serine peptidase [Euryarchaeota archaeon]
MNTNSMILILALIVLLCGQPPGAASMDISTPQDPILTKIDPKLIELASDESAVEPIKQDTPVTQMAVSGIGAVPTVDVIVITSERYDLSGYMGITATSETRLPGTYRTFGSLQIDSDLLQKLLKMASVEEVVAVNSLRPVDAPEPPDPDPVGRAAPEDAVKNNIHPTNPHPAEPDMWLAAMEHGAVNAWNNGFTGTGTKVAVIDSGVDFAHPDLQGTQARVDDPTSPYDGWPIAFDPYSMLYYLAYEGAAFPGIRSWYSNTSSTDVDSNTDGLLDTYGYVVTGIVSQSGTYHVGVHPDKMLYEWKYSEYVAVLVVDITTAGVYDTVYVDLDNDKDFTDEKACVRGDEISWHDLNSDGYADISGGMIYFIADGTNPIPYSDVFAHWWEFPLTIPGNGNLVAFMGSLDFLEDHGTLCASAVAAQGRSGESSWNAGDGFVQGMAPDTKIIAVGNYYNAQILDAYYFAVEGYDGTPGTGDEAQIVSCSFGDSGIINDGWDFESRHIDAITTSYNPEATFTISTGNGGFGYGTASSPLSPGVLSVGASTCYWDYEPVSDPAQYNCGDVIPFSNRGPNAVGQVDPDVVTVGSGGAGDIPLNHGCNGYTAWETWGGTSLSAPATAGELALVYDAYNQTNGVFPGSELARNILMSGADNINYDVLQQGAGFTNADRATRIASEMGGLMVTPASLTVGDYRGTKYEVFSGIISPGESDTLTLTVENHDLSGPVTATISDSVLERTGVWTTTIDADGTLEDGYQFTEPDYLIDITGEIPSGTNLLKATSYIDFSAFDPDGDYEYDEVYRLLVYKWNDLDSDGIYWNDLNGDDVVQAGEVDRDSGYELNRFSYGYNYANINEVFLRDPDPVLRGADAILIGLQHRVGTGSTAVNIQLEFYENADWTWVTESHSTLSVPAGGSATFDATISVPADTGIGLYEGKILVSDSINETVVPVIVNVAADTTTFEFGGNTLTTDLYDNNRIFGGFSWEWRYEVGDWRFYFVDIPDDADIGPGSKLLIDVTWENVPTDIDVHVLGPTSDSFTPDPRYGPYTLDSYGSSADTYIGDGKFRFDTATGGAEEIISADVSTGLHEIVLHNVLYAGQSFSERISGKVATVSINPAEMHQTVPAMTVGSQTFEFVSGMDLSGLSVQAYGLSPPREYVSQSISQDNPYDPMTSSWTREYTVSGAGLIEVSTTSSESIDIDLYLIHDSNDNDLPEPGEIIASSTTPAADECVSAVLPDDGRYWVFVHGWSVPDEPSTFDCTVNVIDGTDLAVSDLPGGAISADTPCDFTVTYTAPDAASVYDGLIFVGPTNAPAALRVPVTITTTEASPPESDPQPVPTLTPHGIVLMIGLLAVAGSVMLRRRE